MLVDETFRTEAGGEERMFTPDDPVVMWTTDRYQCAMAPVPVCKDPVKTTGLGDNITGTGLAYHRLKRVGCCSGEDF
jgi:ADP-dependent glucokinase